MLVSKNISDKFYFSLDLPPQVLYNTKMKDATTKKHIQVLVAFEQKMGITVAMRDWPLNFGENVMEKKDNKQNLLGRVDVAPPYTGEEIGIAVHGLMHPILCRRYENKKLKGPKNDCQM